MTTSGWRHSKLAGIIGVLWPEGSRKASCRMCTERVGTGGLEQGRGKESSQVELTGHGKGCPWKAWVYPLGLLKLQPMPVCGEAQPQKQSQLELLQTSKHNPVAQFWKKRQKIAECVGKIQSCPNSFSGVPGKKVERTQSGPQNCQNSTKHELGNHRSRTICLNHIAS